MNICEVPDGSVLDYLNSNPKLRDIADVHGGIEWNISLKGNKGILISSEPKPGFQKGLNKVPGKIEPYYAQGFVYLNMDEQYRRKNARTFPWDRPKVIANRHTIGRGRWRIVGYPDFTGLVCRENFIGIWPKANVGVEVLSALINSPLVNAVLFVREEKRRNRNATLKQIPIPFGPDLDTERIIQLVRYYITLRSGIKKNLTKESAIQTCIQTLMEIDSLILKAYDLPPRLERKRLEFFRGYRRPVPFDFPNYYPEDFSPCIPLHKYLKMDLKQASAGELLKRITPFDSEEMHKFFMDIEARQF